MNMPTLNDSNSDAPAQQAGGNDFRSDFLAFSELRNTLRASAKAAQVTTMTRSDFMQHITLYMPEVSARIEEEDFGVVHLEMGAMKLATRDAILSQDFNTVRRHLSYIGYLYEHADHELRHAILISYLEALLIGESAPAYSRARRLLPPNLEAELIKAELRHAHLHARAAGF